MIDFFAYLIAVVIVYRRILLIALSFGLVLVGLYIGLDHRVPQIDQDYQVQQHSTETVNSTLGSADRLGRRYVSLEELNAAQRSAGYAPVGFFGKKWPAKVVEVLTDEDGIEFVRGDGVKHTYQGFEGRRMKVVRLATEDNQETLIVYRSDLKK